MLILIFEAATFALSPEFSSRWPSKGHKRKFITYFLLEGELA